jgi:hypothetical protein
MTDNISGRIEEEVTAKMRIHNLKQAHQRLADARTDLRTASMNVEGDAELTGRIATIIVNSIEPLMWKIETYIREGQA